MAHETPIQMDIPLGDRAYQAWVGPGLLASVGERAQALGLGKRCAVITDSTVGPLYADGVLASLRKVGIEAHAMQVPAGEASKSVSQVEDLCRQMMRAGCDRHSFVVALGGGVVGDLAGFVAGIFFRGVPYVQLPSTIVSQVDSSVGGKTGVNAPEGKNLIGVFHQPKLVLADTDTLASLPEREFREGFAEVIKHAAIRDADMIPMIEAVLKDREANLPELMARNIGIKAAVVVEDERETSGTRALLNFGHTIGHGIEAAAGYGQLLHGEAISLGLIAATRLSQRYAGLSEIDAVQIISLLEAFQLPQRLPEGMATEAVMGYLRRDKKFQDGQVRFVLVRALGDACVSSKVTTADMEAEIEALR